MASGSLTTNNRPQKKRRSTNNSSNNSSSQAATALSGKVRNSCQLESGRRGRGGNAKAGCFCGTCVTAVASLSTSMRDGLARLDGHADAALRDLAAAHDIVGDGAAQHRRRGRVEPQRLVDDLAQIDEPRQILGDRQPAAEHAVQLGVKPRLDRRM